jgi:hypothetical protein
MPQKLQFHSKNEQKLDVFVKITVKTNIDKKSKSLSETDVPMDPDLGQV